MKLNLPSSRLSLKLVPVVQHDGITPDGSVLRGNQHPYVIFISSRRPRYGIHIRFGSTFSPGAAKTERGLDVEKQPSIARHERSWTEFASMTLFATIYARARSSFGYGPILNQVLHTPESSSQGASTEPQNNVFVIETKDRTS
uniref:Uncharacterized protein n=1 Tax=Rhizobium rhizogenes TaxID=359 RepID=A0A7S5DRN8_RHIRH|nr:hypothetical protein pC5.8d_742 [Rhizobium rhizogenes]